MRYNIRNVPEAVDSALRKAARSQGKSLNEIALGRGAGLARELPPQRDLADVAGTWRKDPAVDRALAMQDAIGEELPPWVAARYQSLYRPLPR